MKKNRTSAALEAAWYGTEASLQEYLNAQEQMAARIAAGPMDDEEDDGCPYLLSVDDGIATISITGPLTNRESPWNRYFGVASYGAIREALIAAAMDEEVNHVVLDINSGGGAVNGVSDVGALICMINDNVKPVTAYTDGAMCSAAYWLGCSAGAVYCSNVATVGSIGVIATHMEYSKQLKEEGVNVTVMRAGKFKALVNSVEPLTSAAKEQLQSQLDAAYKIFVDHVSMNRGKSYEYTDANMAQGREFFGAQALDAGLVDGVTSFDALIQTIRAQSVDKSNTFTNNPRNLAQGPYNMKKALTAEQLAAAAAGVQIQAAAEPAAAPAVADESAAAPATAEPAAAAAEPAAQAGDANVVAFLQAQLKEKDAALLAANVELAGMKTKVADMEAAHAGLVEIVGKSIGGMSVAMGGSALDYSSMNGVALLAEHKRVADQFTEKFKAGGVAAVDAAEASKGASAPAVPPLFAARVAAVSTAKAK